MTNAFVTSVYLALIVYFYDKTNGFGKENLFNYCLLKSAPILALASMVNFDYTNLTGLNRTSKALGLLFCGIGDFIISFHAYGMVTGALAFGIGHLFYMATFALNMKKISTELAVITIIYAIFINHFFLMPQFYQFPISTLVLMAYSMILCTAVMISGSLYIMGTKTQDAFQKNNLLRFIGYCLFFISDSILLLAHIGYPIPNPALCVLSTYYASQYLILWGAVASHEIIYLCKEAALKNYS